MRIINFPNNGDDTPFERLLQEMSEDVPAFAFAITDDRGNHELRVEVSDGGYGTITVENVHGNLDPATFVTTPSRTEVIIDALIDAQGVQMDELAGGESS